jgi:hypothetical protein
MAEALGPEVRQEVLAGRRKVSKPQVVETAKALRRLKGRLQAEDFSFMRGLATGQQRDALALLARLPADEHALVNALLDQSGLSAREMLDAILRRLPAQPREARQRLYELHASDDPRTRARALREAAGGLPIVLPPLRYLKFAGEGLRRAAKNLDQCAQLEPTAPWTPRLQALIAQIQALQEGELGQVLAEVEAYFGVDPEPEVPAEEAVDDGDDGEKDGDQGMPVPEAEGDDAARLDHHISVGNTDGSELPANAGVATDPLPCGWCGAHQTWLAAGLGRIHCDDCHAVYNPARGEWSPGDRAKQHPTPAPAAGLV